MNLGAPQTRYVAFQGVALTIYLPFPRTEDHLTIYLPIESALAPNYYSFNIIGPKKSSEHLH